GREQSLEEAEEERLRQPEHRRGHLAVRREVHDVLAEGLEPAVARPDRFRVAVRLGVDGPGAVADRGSGSWPAPATCSTARAWRGPRWQTWPTPPTSRPGTSTTTSRPRTSWSRRSSTRTPGD